MFDHPDYDQLTPDTIPLDCDIKLCDEKFMEEYDRLFIDFRTNGGKWGHVEYVVPVAARKVSPTSIELTWFVDLNRRYHAVEVTLPRKQVVHCVSIEKYDEKPIVFVKTGWLEDMFKRVNCVFGLVDAIGVRNAIESGLSFRSKLPALREAIDRVATHHPQIAFISYADSVVLKSNWTTGFFKTDWRMYDPEAVLKAFAAVRAAYQEVLGLNVYGVFTQGANEFSEERLLHVSAGGNHLCMNCFGGPFADLKAIEDAARQRIREKAHKAAELYLDLRFYHSLEKKAKMRPQPFFYQSAISGVASEYVCVECDELICPPSTS
jgi:hypothetical protein